MTGRISRSIVYYVARNNFNQRILAFAAIIACAVSVVTGAQSTERRPEFEAASIKPNASGSDSMGAIAQPGGRFGARNVPLRFLLRATWNVKDFQIVFAGFSWIDTDRYDINAKAPNGTANGFEPLRPMLQSLLADRFNLVVHRETKELPIWNLIAAKGGLKLVAPKDASCVIPDPKNPRPREEMPFCDNIQTGRGLIEAWGVTIPRLLTALSDVLGRMVVDKTGFKGIFDGRLEFTPDETIADPVTPSIFTALPEQLGLKVEPAKGPVDVLIVDRAERPTAN